MCNEFVKSRLQRQLFDAIPKSILKAIVSMKKRNIDLHLETTKALRYDNFARARCYDLSWVFKCELSEVPFFLVKHGIMHKTDNKNELE